MINLTQNDIFAIYRLPYTSETIIILQKELLSIRYNKNNTNDRGFVLFPFSTKTHKSFLIKADIILKNKKFNFETNIINNLKDIDKRQYITKVIKFTAQTKSNLSKIVLSRTKSIENSGLSIYNIFINLEKTYPNAMVFLVNHPETGTWMGATPEILLEKNKNKIKTIALAGTQLIKPGSQTIWKDKEIKEQKAVMDFIENIMDKHKLNYKSEGPYTKQVAEFKKGILVHLATDYHAKKNNNIYDLLLDLHPTPAVSGLPKEEAIKYILENEDYDREYYAGFLGPQNIEKNDKTNFFVNLRSMQIYKNKFLLYIGGGLNNQSIPENEWIETENKAYTLTSIIHGFSQLNGLKK